MRTSREIYEQYRIPPWLQEHQLRVAAVGALICDNFKGDIDRHLVVATCLVHDIGAIVKFDFTFTTHAVLKELCPLEDVPYWLAVQEEMRTKYGVREHAASDAILQELGLEDVRRVFRDMGFSNMSKILAGNTSETRVAQYSDMRVGPHGILTLRDRFEDARKRYTSVEAATWRDSLDEYLATAEYLEKGLFERVAIVPEDITNESIAPIIEQLWDYPVTTS